MVATARPPDAGDLVWLSFTPQAGREQAGRRPGLVISPRLYNQRSGMCLACPVTSHVKGYPFEVALPEGLAVTGVVLADHIRNLDWRARDAEFIATVSTDVLGSVRDRLLPLLGS